MEAFKKIINKATLRGSADWYAEDDNDMPDEITQKIVKNNLRDQVARHMVDKIEIIETTAGPRIEYRIKPVVVLTMEDVERIMSVLEENM